MEQIKIIQEKENPLFGRKEIQIEVVAKITPKKDEAEKLISEKFSVSLDGIKIKQILGKFGSNHFKIIANVYKTKEEKEKTEFKSKKEKEAEAKALEEAKKIEEEKKAEEEAKQKVEETKESEIKPEEAKTE
ncbi:MAG: hypothetical protein Q8P15_00070 [Nanoarchaeota archaeon]|nr:hypothetical protein [Nanoarchaeota archaeon]